MRNQVDAASKLGIRSATLNSTNPKEWENITADILQNKVKKLTEQVGLPPDQKSGSLRCFLYPKTMGDVKFRWDFSLRLKSKVLYTQRLGESWPHPVSIDSLNANKHISLVKIPHLWRLALNSPYPTATDRTN